MKKAWKITNANLKITNIKMDDSERIYFAYCGHLSVEYLLH